MPISFFMQGENEREPQRAAVLAPLLDSFADPANKPVELHAGPGSHPVGSSQKVHGGGGGTRANSSTRWGSGGSPDNFTVMNDGDRGVGMVNSDFPNDKVSETRGEIWYIEVTEGNRKKGRGFAMAQDILEVLREKGMKTVNMSGVSPEGNALIEKLIRMGEIGEKLRSSKSGKAEYTLLYPKPMEFHLRVAQVPVELHEGPGNHPGTGSSQKAHAGTSASNVDIDSLEGDELFDALLEKAKANSKKRADQLEALRRKYPLVVWQYSDVPSNSVVGNMVYTTAGSYDSQSGTITLYPAAFDENKDVDPGVPAHEYQHHRLNRIRRRAIDEKTRASRLAEKGKFPFDEDGLLKDDYRDQFPALTFYEDWLLDGESFSELQELDGVTSYSISFWKELSGDPSDLDLANKAINETLAEIARLEVMGELQRVDDFWLHFYADQVELFNQIVELHIGPGNHPSGSSQKVHGGETGASWDVTFKEHADLLERMQRTYTEEKEKAIEGTLTKLRRKYPKVLWSYNKTDKTFVIGDESYDTAATYDPSKGTIVIYPPAFDGKGNLDPGVAEHEYQHHVSFRIRKMLIAETAELDDMEFDNPNDSPFKEDGFLRESAKAHYPATDLYQRFQANPDAWEELQFLDGVTEYSMSWWIAFEKNPTGLSAYQAINETLAEVAWLEARDELHKVDDLWLDFYFAQRELFNAY